MADEERDGVRLTSLDSPLGDGLEVTKRDLVDHVDAFADYLGKEVAKWARVVRETGAKGQ